MRKGKMIQQNPSRARQARACLQWGAATIDTRIIGAVHFRLVISNHQERPTNGWAGVDVANKDISTLASNKSCKLGARGFSWDVRIVPKIYLWPYKAPEAKDKVFPKIGSRAAVVEENRDAPDLWIETKICKINPSVLSKKKHSRRHWLDRGLTIERS